MSKIAFVGNFQYHCGSSNTLLGYAKAGPAMGHDVRVSEFGAIDDTIRAKIPTATRNWNVDLIVIVYESYPFLSNQDIREICRTVPRSKRVVLDPDGKYLEPRFSGNDTNHPTPDSYKYWTNLYDSLSDIILQPFLGTSPNPKIHSFLYFGMDNQISDLDKIRKEFDLIYVGNNWYRWPDIYWLIKAVSLIRLRLKKIGLVGRYWTGEPMEGFEDATRSDSEFLKRNNIDIQDSAPYGQVEAAMSAGKLHPVLVRPILNEIRFVTPRMFETFGANTIPLIPTYFTHALSLYGNKVVKLIISENPASDIIRIMDNYETYSNLCKDICQKLRDEHSYEVRLKQLVEFI